MPIQKQLIPIQFGGGINTKVDPKQLQSGNLLTLTNGQFSKQGSINKRYGYDILNSTVEGGGSITQGIELTTYKNELLLFDSNYIYSYLPSTGNWSNRGVAISVTTEDKSIIKTSAAQQLNPDLAYLNNMEVYAWEDSRGGVRYSTLDNTTKAFALSDGLVSIDGQQPKCIAFQNNIFILYTDGSSQIFYKLINSLNPTVIQEAITIVTDGYSGFNGFAYDAEVIGDKLFITYLGGSPNTGAIRCFYLDSQYLKSATVVVNDTVGQAINDGYHGAVSVSGDSSQNVWIGWSNGIDVRVSKFSYILDTLLDNILIDTIDCRILTGIKHNTSFICLYEAYSSNSVNTQIRYKSLSDVGVLGALNTIRSVGISTKPWTYSDNVYITGSYESTLQSTNFTLLIANSTLLTNTIVVAKQTAGISGGHQTNGMCPNIVLLSNGIFKFANLSAGKLISEANTLFSIYGVNSSKLSFNPSNNFINVIQSNTLLIVGGILQGYDGVSVTELGFHIYPEGITAVAAGSDGSLSTGSYQYIVEFEWTDNIGQIYRSAPSTGTTVNVTAGNHVVITGPTLRLTQKNGITRTAASIVIYRTTANSGIFHRVTSTISPLLNDNTVDSFTFTDTLSDIDISSNELNYTTGNVLANIAPPANSIITTYNNRVFLAGLSDKLELWYSQTVVNNTNENTIPPQFSQELSIGVDPLGGDIIALGLLNQTLIIFKAGKIFSLQGNGPDATGNNNDYGDATLITSDVGCINEHSVLIMPLGLMFQSNKGIYLLDQSLNVEYIGAPVESYNEYTITSSTLDPIANQIIFTTVEGTALVYDYFFKQWSTWTNHYATSSNIYNNRFTYLKKDGHVYVQNTDKFTDGSVPIYLSWTLPNLSFSGLQGYQRVFRCFILGTYKGAHSLNISVAYDYNSVYTQHTTITPSTNVSTWGSSTTWGDSAIWGGSYQIYEFRIDFNIQKCTSIRLYVSDNQTSNYNEGYSISSVVFEVGALPGGNRLPTTNVYGAE